MLSCEQAQSVWVCSVHTMDVLYASIADFLALDNNNIEDPFPNKHLLVPQDSAVKKNLQL